MEDEARRRFRGPDWCQQHFLDDVLVWLVSDLHLATGRDRRESTMGEL